jgi:hypothetical protein
MNLMACPLGTLNNEPEDKKRYGWSTERKLYVPPWTTPSIIVVFGNDGHHCEDAETFIVVFGNDGHHCRDLHLVSCGAGMYLWELVALGFQFLLDLASHQGVSHPIATTPFVIVVCAPAEMFASRVFPGWLAHHWFNCGPGPVLVFSSFATFLFAKTLSSCFVPVLVVGQFAVRVLGYFGLGLLKRGHFHCQIYNSLLRFDGLHPLSWLGMGLVLVVCKGHTLHWSQRSAPVVGILLELYPVDKLFVTAGLVCLERIDQQVVGLFSSCFESTCLSFSKCIEVHDV